MSVVPPAIPVTIPVVEPIVPTAAVLLLHVPAEASVSVVVLPTQTVFVPLIEPGNGFTVTTATV